MTNENSPELSISTGGVKLLSTETVVNYFNNNNLTNIAFNITPIMSDKVSVNHIKSLFKAYNISCNIIDGGWCNFIEQKEFEEKTISSINKQVKIAKFLNSRRIRLFFGHYEGSLNQNSIINSSKNITSVCERYPEVEFLFENEKGISSNLEFLKNIILKIKSENFGLNFDTVNFELNNINPITAFECLKSKIVHFHIKGKKNNELSEYGNGDSQIDEVIKMAKKSNIFNSASVEYEGHKDRLETLTSSALLFIERLENGYF